jgi:hypothetical protein
MFREAVLAVPAAYGDDVGEYAVHLYSDDPDYVFWAREAIGWPVKMGTISISQPWPTRQLERGSQVQAILQRNGRRLITVTLEFTEPLPRDLYPRTMGPQYTVKTIPSAEQGLFAIRQVVAVRPSPPTISDAWRAEASMTIEASPSDELHFFVPFELVRAEYVPFLDLTMPYGKILVEL